MGRSEVHRLLSRPLDVHWCGWRSTTLDLQQHGWELSVEQDIMRCSMRVAMRHQAMQCVAMSQPIQDFRYEQHARGEAMYQRAERCYPPIIIQYFASRMTVQLHAMGMESWNMKPIDAAPQFVSHEIKSLEDMNWFATPLVRTNEIIVEPQDVASMLEKIKAMQAPEQAALRAKQRMQGRREGMTIEAQPRQVFHAQILSIAA